MKERILLTGGSGFLGKNILPILSEKYEVESIGLANTDTYQFDISEGIPDFLKNYDIVLHAAGKAHSVPKTETEIKTFFDINVQGTKNLCFGLEKYKIPRAFIFISSVAVYGIESGIEITEEYPLNGSSPYAKSKILAESFLHEWCKNHNITLGIIRPALIAGSNPPGNLGSMINAIKSGKYFRIGKGNTRKSIVMAKDIAQIVPRLSEIGGIYNLCDDRHPSFKELETLIASQLENRDIKSLPLWFAKMVALFGDLIGKKFPLNSITLNKIVKPLTFSNEKAKKYLNWKPLDVLDEFKII